jgi:hypothetical protein
VSPTELLRALNTTVEDFTHAAEPYIRLGELAALVLAIVAIVFAYRQYKDSAEQSGALEKVLRNAGEQRDALTNVLRKAETQLAKLEIVANALPTRFVGTFPSNLHEILEVVRSTESHLLVLVDFAGYGYYSAPREFAAYYQELRKTGLRSGVEVQMICYNRTAGDAAAEYQFPRDAFAAERAGEMYRHFFDVCFPHVPKPETWEAFNDASWSFEDDYRQALHLTGWRLLEAATHLPFTAWVRDHKEAIATFQNLTRFGDEFCFRTTDPQFVRFFEKQIREVAADATPYTAPVGRPRQPLLAIDHATIDFV